MEEKDIELVVQQANVSRSKVSLIDYSSFMLLNLFTLQGLRQSPYCNIRSFAVDSKKNVHSMLKMLWSVEVPL